MNGKGSKRHPALVSEEIVQARWDNTFPKKPKTKVWSLPTRPKTEYSHLGDFSGQHK
jgi:hypothetical protein